MPIQCPLAHSTDSVHFCGTHAAYLLSSVSLQVLRSSPALLHEHHRLHLPPDDKTDADTLQQPSGGHTCIDIISMSPSSLIIPPNVCWALWGRLGTEVTAGSPVAFQTTPRSCWRLVPDDLRHAESRCRGDLPRQVEPWIQGEDKDNDSTTIRQWFEQSRS